MFFQSRLSLLKILYCKSYFREQGNRFSFSHLWHFFCWYQILFLEKLLQWMVIAPPAVTAGKIILETCLFVIFQKKILKALDFRNDFDELYLYQRDSLVLWQLLFVITSQIDPFSLLIVYPIQTLYHCFVLSYFHIIQIWMLHYIIMQIITIHKES